MANNHFVPRFILRNFDEKISIFSLSKNKLTTNRNVETAFSQKDLYPDMIEKLFNEMIEQKTAAILRKKILTDEKTIHLNTVEILILKKFLLIQMFRTKNVVEGFSSKAIEHYRAVASSAPLNFKENTDFIKLSTHEYWIKTLECVLKCESLDRLKDSSETTAFALCFATGYISGNIGIWDTTDCGEELLIMDQGMTSEHEKSTDEYMYKDLMKRGYIFSKISKGKEVSKQLQDIFISNNLFHENFYFHSISKSRIIVLINPFFKLYNGGSFNVNKNTEEIPDIWPTKIDDINLITSHPDDTNEFDVKQLSLRDAIYLNVLTLDRIQDILGFNELGKIRRSLLVYNNIGKYKRNNYDSLLKEIELFGYDVKLNNTLLEILNSILSTSFTYKELSYISELDKQLNKLVNN